ncbi:hypothetical protein [Subtercola boreus]|uniref:hypothetical protein n=1 Tax=Subtercola boreus TaxID=120213 RepID=UPI00209BCD72|nr:hypothetical protein [Subtercola boreus]
MKSRFLMAAASLAALAILTPAMPALALDDNPADRLRIYEHSGDELDFPGSVTLPGSGAGGSFSVPGGGGSGGGSGKGGDSSKGGDKKKKTATLVVNNPDAGKNRARQTMILEIKKSYSSTETEVLHVETTKDFQKYANLTPEVAVAADGTRTQTGENFTIDPIIASSMEQVANQIFAFSGGLFSKCEAYGTEHLTCTFTTPRVLPKNAPSPGKPFVADLAPGTVRRDIPMCSGAYADGGPGIQTVVTLADVQCESNHDNEPVRIEIGTIYSDASLGIPTTRGGDGSIIYEAPASAEGYYVYADAWAITADGQYSWPFPIVIRNHYAPVAQNVPTIEAVRGVDTVVPAAQLFSDVDVEHQAESSDHLTPTVLAQPAQGGAWFDSSGNLHFQSIDVIRGEYTDHVTVKASDTFGLSSTDLTLNVHITDLTPGCETGGVTTDANTPVRIQLSCSVTPVAGWRQISGLSYAITAVPEFGTLSGFDPVSGTATYTPDAGHPGPVAIGFTADNNGASRQATYAVNVLPAP